MGGAIAAVYVAAIGPFVEFMARRGWVAILLFAMLYKFGDSLASALATPFFLKLGFSKIEIANVAKVYGFAATMIGLFIGGWLMNAVGLVRSLWICGVLQLLSNLAFAALAAMGNDLVVLALAVGFENLTGGMGTAALVAYLSSLCNVSYTATQYALLSSFTAVARTWLSSSAGYLAEWLGWVWFFSATALAALPGLLLLAWLTRRGSVTRPVGATPVGAAAID
jgi:PAT family beta-lactamase induction signal transducer AmpG